MHTPRPEENIAIEYPRYLRETVIPTVEGLHGDEKTAYLEEKIEEFMRNSLLFSEADFIEASLRIMAIVGFHLSRYDTSNEEVLAKAAYLQLRDINRYSERIYIGRDMPQIDFSFSTILTVRTMLENFWSACTGAAIPKPIADGLVSLEPRKNLENAMRYLDHCVQTFTLGYDHLLELRLQALLLQTLKQPLSPQTEGVIEDLRNTLEFVASTSRDGGVPSHRLQEVRSDESFRRFVHLLAGRSPCHVTREPRVDTPVPQRQSMVSQPAPTCWVRHVCGETPNLDDPRRFITPPRRRRTGEESDQLSKMLGG